MSDTVMELKEVWKVYQMGEVQVPALQGVSFRIARGDFVAVVGASGSGKSTVLNLIGALDSPSRGHVFLDGIDLSGLPDSRLARIRGKKIGFVFQTFNLYPTLTVSGNIALPMRIHEFAEDQVQGQVEALAGKVGLSHRLGHKPSQLSGGEKQRVAVARALAPEPSLLLADEPTGNLDTRTSHDIMNLFRELHAREGKTIVVVTHEADIAAYAERIIELKDGKVVFDGKNGDRKTGGRA